MLPFLSPPPIDVDRELAAMRAELAAIRSRMQDGWMDEERAGAVRDIVRDALADSATRTSFLTGDWDAGYAGGEGGGAYFRARNGSATMNLAGMVQNRFVASSAYGPVSPPPQDTNTRWGFETKTLFLVMSGQVIDKSITYVGVIAYTSQTNRFIIVPGSYRVPYASIRKGIADGMGISMGLLNVPWDLESNYLGSSTLTSGDYSVFNYRFGAGKSPGATVDWTGSWMRATAGVFNQLGTLSTSWESRTNLSFCVAARAEAKWGIEWSQISRMSSASGDSPGLVLGLGGCMSNGRGQNPQPPGGLATPSAQGFTADARVMLPPAVLIAQYAYMRDPVGGPELGWYQGVNLQASSFVAPGVEPFVEACWMDDVPVEWIAQAGINLYEGSKRVKITLKAVIPFGGGNVNGIRAINGGLGIATSDNNASFIAQLQLRF
ncbi:MAG: hypothetical protein ACKOFI_02010 [Phycisphaerales bacterium]